MSEITTQQSEVQKPVTGHVGIGISYIQHPTPMWVTWIFRIQFVLNKAILMWLGMTNVVTGENVKEFIIILAVIDFVVWGLGRFVGIKKSDFET